MNHGKALRIHLLYLPLPPPPPLFEAYMYFGVSRIRKVCRLVFVSVFFRRDKLFPIHSIGFHWGMKSASVASKKKICSLLRLILVHARHCFCFGRRKWQLLHKESKLSMRLLINWNCLMEKFFLFDCSSFGLAVACTLHLLYEKYNIEDIPYNVWALYVSDLNLANSRKLLAIILWW